MGEALDRRLNDAINRHVAQVKMNESQITERELITRKEAASYITSRWFPISVSTLNKYAQDRSGPPFTRFTRWGPTYYRKSEIDTWVDTFNNRPTGALTGVLNAQR